MYDLADMTFKNNQLHFMRTNIRIPGFGFFALIFLFRFPFLFPAPNPPGCAVGHQGNPFYG